jgi:hypothetical protein
MRWQLAVFGGLIWQIGCCDWIGFDGLDGAEKASCRGKDPKTGARAHRSSIITKDSRAQK